MRILLLSCDAGGGHNSAAEAIREECLSRGIECDLRDTLLFVSKSHSRVVRQGHSYIYRHLPRLFGVGYRFEEKHRPKFIYDQISLGVKKFAAFLEENHYDAVVTTHIFGNMLMTELRRQYGINLSHYAVITDYAMWPGTDMVDARRFFVAANELCDWYEAGGISKDRIVVSGIPISSCFLNTMGKGEARTSLALPSDEKIVLLFGGSMGCGRLQHRVPELERSLPDGTRLVVICGNNRQLFKRLRRKCNRQKVIVVGYTDRVADYMAAADLCLTKPGGLSTTELWAVKLPMVLMLSVPGCESHNLDYFKRKGMAVGTDDWRAAIHLTADLVLDECRLVAMQNRMTELNYPGGASVIIDSVLSDLSEG